ncbi:MAG: hypothetical protein NZ761_13920, partial [Dehalococcoidia bacterium]|nr:hypothetical protein [Dehalococcoidia bacterium]
MSDDPFSDGSHGGDSVIESVLSRLAGSEFAAVDEEALVIEEPEELGEDEDEALEGVTLLADEDEGEGLDDPVRMYLREIGKVYLLTADDEKHLARQREEWLHLDAICKRYQQAYGHPPSAARMAVALLEQWAAVLPVYEEAKRYIDHFERIRDEEREGADTPGETPRWRDPGAPQLSGMTHSEVVDDPQFRGMLDNELDVDFRAHLMRTFGWEEARAHDSIVLLSTVTHILGGQLVAEMGELAGGEERLLPPAEGLVERLAPLEETLRYHFDTIRDNGI